MQLILASQSIGRKKLLEQLKIPFQVIPNTIDEEKIIAETPLSTLKLRAKMKCQDVVKKLKTQSASWRTTYNHLILSADSGAILNNELIGKPKDYHNAITILKKLSGKTHQFVTAVYMIKISNLKTPASPAGRQISKLQRKTQKEKDKQKATKTPRGWPSLTWTPPTVEVSDHSFVTFRKLTDEDIKRYLSITRYKKYAGGYAIASTQDFITKIEGSISNVIGLPLEKVLPVLRKNRIIP